MVDPIKSELIKSRRAPQFVSRRTAAALLDLSLSAFNAWVRNGVLPPPAPGASAHEARWDWDQVCRWMRGDRSDAPRDLLGEQLARMGHKRGPQRGAGGRPRVAKEDDHGG